jgi:formate dehydrogenase subunit gamma
MSSDPIDAAIAASGHLPGGLLQVLHGIADRLGHIPAEAIGRVAAALNLSRAEVSRRGQLLSRLSRGAAGAARAQAVSRGGVSVDGVEALAARLERRLGCRFGETSPATGR